MVHNSQLNLCGWTNVSAGLRSACKIVTNLHKKPGRVYMTSRHRRNRENKHRVRSLTHFGEWKDPRDSVVAISQFVVSWISLTNFANIKNSVGSIAQSTQPLKTTLPKSCTIRIFEHFRSIVDDSTPCFFSCDVWRLSLFRIQSKSVSWEGHLPQIQKKLLQVYPQSLPHNWLINFRSFCVSASWG